MTRQQGRWPHIQVEAMASNPNPEATRIGNLEPEEEPTPDMDNYSGEPPGTAAAGIYL